MARSLYDTEPVFREVIDRCDAALPPDADGLTLKAVSILGWEASGITDVDQMLSGCSTYILATEKQREFLNKITGSTQHGIWTRNLS